MRVVAGEARGRRLQTPPGDDTRPTLDRVREALFNALVSLDAVADARVLDLFAGSGALGIEALSRGAAQCTFVERSAAARRVVQINLNATGLADRGKIVAVDATAFLAGAERDEWATAFDLVLLDPPYATDAATWEGVLVGVRLIAPDAVVVTESDRDVFPTDGWHVLRTKGYGGTVVSIAQPSSPPPEPS